MDHQRAKISVILLITLLIFNVYSQDIDLGYVGRRESQLISLESLFGDRSLKTDQYEILNPEDYENLLSLDEPSKLKDGSFQNIKLQTVKLKEDLSQ
jgi:hypothetical protein